MRFSQQRWLGWIILIVLSIAAVWGHHQYLGKGESVNYLSGWILFGVILLLTIYNGRKKIPFLPVFSSETWLQFHIYAGLLTGVIFAIHADYKLPQGWFRGMLTGLYSAVMLSGIFGLFISRAIPKRLTTHGGEVLFERIPAIRTALKEQSETLALESVGHAKAAIIADFYGKELAGFFAKPKNLVKHLMEVRNPLNHLLTRINEISRYLGQGEQATMDKIAQLVRQKDGLDYHYAHQLLLRVWLFIHIPLTYSLLLFIFAHIVLVYAFAGGAR